MQRQVEQARRLFELDRAEHAGGVELPHALERKYPNAGKEWGWFWAFPAHNRPTDPRSGVIRRHHVYEKSLQRSIKRAVRDLGLPSPISVHTLRHCFATYLLEGVTTFEQYKNYWDTRMCGPR